MWLNRCQTWSLLCCWPKLFWLSRTQSCLNITNDSGKHVLKPFLLVLYSVWAEEYMFAKWPWSLFLYISVQFALRYSSGTLFSSIHLLNRALLLSMIFSPPYFNIFGNISCSFVRPGFFYSLSSSLNSGRSFKLAFVILI